MFGSGIPGLPRLIALRGLGRFFGLTFSGICYLLGLLAFQANPRLDVASRHACWITESRVSHSRELHMEETAKTPVTTTGSFGRYADFLLSFFTRVVSNFALVLGSPTAEQHGTQCPTVIPRWHMHSHSR